MNTRKIIHIDMDAFYASVELREQPHLKGWPVVVAGQSSRSVVCAASYEARQYGLRSAMSVVKAKQLCPQVVIVPPHFDLYKKVSRQIHQIFAQYTDLIEPVALDEAYLDVTHNLKEIPSATWVAQEIREHIFQQTQLTASAGVAPNKFLAKIASDWKKPNGLFVVSPKEVMSFLLPLPLEKIPGVGKATLAKMHTLKLFTVADLQKCTLGELVCHFGSYGYRLQLLAQGIDDRPVRNRGQAKNISAEQTFLHDLPLDQVFPSLQELAKKVTQQCLQKGLYGHCVTLKLKTHDFKTSTRSLTLGHPIYSEEDIHASLRHIIQHLEPDFLSAKYRLVGVGVSEFISQEKAKQQLALFE